MTRLLLTSTILALATTTAIANPLEDSPPLSFNTAPTAAPLEGFYIGIEGGQVSGHADYWRYLVFESVPALGVFAAYNFQNGSTVFGGEVRTLHFNDFIDYLDRNEVRAVIELRWRVGMTRGDALFYGAVGYSVASVDPEGETIFDMDGLNVGAGVEYNITDNFFVRGDFTHRTLRGDLVTRPWLRNTPWDQNLQTVTVSAGYRF